MESLSSSGMQLYDQLWPHLDLIGNDIYIVKIAGHKLDFLFEPAAADNNVVDLWFFTYFYTLIV